MTPPSPGNPIDFRLPGDRLIELGEALNRPDFALAREIVRDLRRKCKISIFFGDELPKPTSHPLKRGGRE